MPHPALGRAVSGEAICRKVCVVSGNNFTFSQGNLRKLLFAPLYALTAVLSWCVPRSPKIWVFGSGIGVGEGPLAVARLLVEERSDEHVYWMVANEDEAQAAARDNIEPVQRSSWRGFWLTLRAGHIIVSHGVGDVNRFGVVGGHVSLLIHGTPLKKMHLDSAATTTIQAPAIVQRLLRSMYLRATKELSFMTAGSQVTAQRLRSAYRLLPGKVQVLGDPRIDIICEQVAHPQLQRIARATVAELLQLTPETATQSTLILLAPTWRDGAEDTGVPNEEELSKIREFLAETNAYLVVRPHPLGVGAYAQMIGDRVLVLDSQLAHEITPLLAGFDALITDYSSIAVDFSLLSRPIVWFAPDLLSYGASRGLYEPLEVTAQAQVQTNWHDALMRLREVCSEGPERRIAVAHAMQLRQRFIEHSEGGAASRVLAELRASSEPINIPKNAIFFESFYGKQATCNPLALDREISKRHNNFRRYWSVENETVAVPEGAIPVVVGSREWFAARAQSSLVIVNDWLRYGFKRSSRQTVLQTWHGTMLKHLALTRPGVSIRTNIAIRRESRRWNLLLSQNPHATAQFKQSYAYRGEILELGYPRNDRLALSVSHRERLEITQRAAKRALGFAEEDHVVLYAPTWRDRGINAQLLDANLLAEKLPSHWKVMVRGHSREVSALLVSHPRVVDMSTNPDVNDLILAADFFITDYSSLMFDVSVARVPMAFYVPDLATYRDQERGFTFDFENDAPGPLLTNIDELVPVVTAGVVNSAKYDSWCTAFNPHDDGSAARRVVDALERKAILPRSHA